jgi:predicted transposase/invertase (TIGR01784 family)
MPLKDKAHNPHDGYFQAIMRNKESAVDFLKNYLPADILRFIDIKTLQIKKDSFITKELKRFYSDILYQVAIKDHKAYIYLLFEHKSYPEKLIAFILLKYMVKIWELECKQQPELRLLPPIIPLVFYHGKEKWNIGSRLSDSIFLGDREELKVWIPDFTYTLYDFSPYSDAQIKGSILLKICLDLFKHIFDKDLSHVRKIIQLLKALSLDERTALEFIEATFWYIMSVRDDANPGILREIVEQAISKEAGGVVMTVAEQLKQEGRKEGREEGRKEGELIGSIRTAQLMKGRPVSDKKELEKLSIDELEKMLKKLTEK